jgi:hypothetical protein
MPSWRQVAGRLTAAVQERALDAIRERVASNVRVESIAFRVDEAVGGYLVHTSWRFSSLTPGDRRPLAFNSRHCRQKLIDIWVDGVPDQDRRPPPVPITILDLPGEYTAWSSATVRMTVFWEPSRRWEGGASTPVLVLPDALPVLIEGAEERPHAAGVSVEQPNLVLASPLPSGLDRAGLRRGAEPGDQSSNHLQVALFERRGSYETAQSAHGRIILMGPPLAGLVEADRRQIGGLVESAMQFVSGRFQVAVSSDLLIYLLAPDDRPVPMVGVCLIAPPRWFGIGATPEEVHGVSVVRLVCNIWVGVGCRVAGACGLPLAMGIGAGMGVLLLDALGEEGLAKETLQRYGHFQPTSTSAQDASSAALIIGMVASGLFSRATTEPQVLSTLGAFVRAQWGTIVRSDDVLRVLGQIGIKMPHGRARDWCQSS